ncbi:hypothetical protein KSP39_PZI020604 [Platanthera zijinensis]|uniref:Uncharacterized protein n=1 Tax=Platanthera zijinensis TaxID=2320716 RepID=A0AAP0AZS8_9ASPA
MTLRDMNRMALHGGAKKARSAGVHASRSIKDTATGGYGGSANRASQLPGSVNSGRNGKNGVTEEEIKRRRAEEALRTIMFLSCWGPN